MKDYYEILGVDQGAKKNEIKKAYRFLALKYHPDINPSNDAKNLFQEINEAYTFLMDDERRKIYDESINQSHSESTSATEVIFKKPKRSRRNSNFFKERVDRERLRRKQQRAKLAYYSRMFSIISYVFIFALAIDYWLPDKSITQPVLNRYSSYTPSPGEYIEINAKICPIDHKIPIEELNIGTTVTFHLTPCFKIVKSFDYQFRNETISKKPKFNIYNPFYFFIIITFFISLDVLFVEKQISSIINFTSINAALFLISLLILAIS